jgi:hypothetical protein
LPIQPRDNLRQHVGRDQVVMVKQRRTNSPRASSSAALELPEMPRLRSRSRTRARGSRAASSSSSGRIPGVVEAPSAMHSSPIGISLGQNAVQCFAQMIRPML